MSPCGGWLTEEGRLWKVVKGEQLFDRWVWSGKKWFVPEEATAWAKV